MYKKNLIIAGSIALSLHAAVVMMMPEVTSEPKVIFRKGESSLKMNLVPSVASTASIKSINTQKNVQKGEEKKNDNPQPVKKPQIIEKEQVKVEEEVKKENEEKEITYGAEYFKTQKEINTKQPQKQKSNTATQNSKEIIADVKVKGVTMGAMVKNVFKPSYPSSCKRLGHEGATVLKVTILSKGKCGSIEIIKSAGCESLDKAAIKALKKAKYIPANG